MLARMYETGIGAGWRLLASRFVLPVYGGDQARQQIRTILARCGTAFAAGGRATRVPGARSLRSRWSAISSCSRIVCRTQRRGGARAALRRSRWSGSSTFLRVLQTYLLLVEQAAGRLAEVGDARAGRAGAGRLSRGRAGGVRRGRHRGRRPRGGRRAVTDPARGGRHGRAAAAGQRRARRCWRWSSTRSTARHWRVRSTRWTTPSTIRPLQPWASRSAVISDASRFGNHHTALSPALTHACPRICEGLGGACFPLSEPHVDRVVCM